MRKTTRIILGLAFSAVLTLGAGGTALADHRGQFHEHPPTGSTPNEFATKCHDLLGPFRSAIARGDLEDPLAGIPGGFSGSVNPGQHQGTVAEQEFLATVFGITCP